MEYSLTMWNKKHATSSFLTIHINRWVSLWGLEKRTATRFFPLGWSLPFDNLSLQTVFELFEFWCHLQITAVCCLVEMHLLTRGTFLVIPVMSINQVGTLIQCVSFYFSFTIDSFWARRCDLRKWQPQLSNLWWMPIAIVFFQVFFKNKELGQFFLLLFRVFLL